MVKRVLIIAYYFPPNPEVAAIRMGGLAKFLPSFGWEPIIITPNLYSPGDPALRVIRTKDSDILLEWKQRLKFTNDRTVREQLWSTGKNDTPVDRALNIVKEVLAYPDYQKGWYNNTIPAARDFLMHENVSALISSAGPYTSHIIAHDLKKEFDIPWIADFRDLWTQDHHYNYSRVREFFEKKLEIRILSNADYISTVSRSLADSLQMLHHSSVHVIPNGFDPDLLNFSEVRSRKFTITFTGRIYRQKMDPEPFFRAVRELIDAKIIDLSDLDIHFWGNFEPWLASLVGKYGLSGSVWIHKRVTRKDAIEIQRRSQILLLFAWNDPAQKGILTGKIFEYLAARRPILAIGSAKDEIADLLEATRAGVFADTDDRITEILAGFFHQFRQYGYVPYSGVDNVVQQYSQKEMAKKFSQLLNAT
jgi:glycosyltransferase involved in cell wall biosynthesis